MLTNAGLEADDLPSQRARFPVGLLPHRRKAGLEADDLPSQRG